MSLSMKKTGTVAFLVGVAIPLLIEILGRYLNTINIHPGLWVSTVVLYLWPTSLALIETSGNWKGYLAFVVSAIANGLLYALVAVFIYFCATFVRKRGWDA